jgi:hypothetical protein
MRTRPDDRRAPLVEANRRHDDRLVEYVVTADFAGGRAPRDKGARIGALNLVEDSRLQQGAATEDQCELRIRTRLAGRLRPPA